MVGDGGRIDEARGVPAADRLRKARQPQVGEAPRHHESRRRFLTRLQLPAPAQPAAQPAVERRRGVVAAGGALVEQARRVVRFRQRGRPGVAVLPAEQGQAHRAVVGPVGQGLAAHVVAELDLIDVDVAPRPSRRIHDLNMRFFAGQVAHVPVAPLQPLVVLAGGGADDLAVHQQVDARLARLVAAADQEADVAALDREVRRRERADGVVAVDPAVHQPLALEAGHRLLAGQRAVDRPRAEGLAGHLPVAVVLALEVGENDRRLAFLVRRPRLGGAFEEQVRLAGADAVAQPGAGNVGVRPDGVLEPAGQLHVGGRLTGVLHGEMQHRGRQAGIGDVEGDERRKSLQRHAHREAVGFVFHFADRVFAAEGNVGEAGAVERALFRLAVELDADGEALVERLVGLGRVGVVGVAGADDLIENVPVPELAVAAEVELAGAEAADRHADQGGFAAAVDLRLAAGRQGAHPFRRQLLVEGDELAGVLRGERAGDEAGLGQQRGRAQADELEELAAVGGWGFRRLAVHGYAFRRCGRGPSAIVIAPEGRVRVKQNGAAAKRLGWELTLWGQGGREKRWLEGLNNDSRQTSGPVSLPQSRAASVVSVGASPPTGES